MPAPVLPGPIRQNGYVVTDLQATIAQWVDLGVGPWFVIQNLTMTVDHRGSTSQPELSIAFANSGDLQLELIQQHNDAPSLYREFLDAGHEGHHHHAWWTDDFDAVLARAAAAGWTTTMSGDGGGMTRFCYLERPEHPDEVIEVMELTATTGPFMDAIRAAAVDWDGTDPVR